MPIIADWNPEGELVAVRAHLARANEHWRRIVNGSAALLDVAGADSYVSPSWYASKRDHGRVVPTWNYTSVQIRGQVQVHDDPDWVLQVVTDLTERHEGQRAEPWSVTDAPEKYGRTRLKAIVGVEIAVDEVIGKAKLSQNRSDADREGVIEGLARQGDSGSVAMSGLMAQQMAEND